MRDAGGQTATTAVAIRVAARLVISTSTLREATEKEPYRAGLTTAGGVAPTGWRLFRGALPRGIGLDRARGVVAGTPRKKGVYAITVRATDRLGASAKKTLPLVVR